MSVDNQFTVNNTQILGRSFGLIAMNGVNDSLQSGLFSGIFGALKQLATSFWHLILFPAAIAMDAVRVSLAWLELYRARNKNASLVVRAVVETIGFVLAATAVMGSIVAAAVFGAAVPLIFLGAMLFKAMYHFTLACKHGIQALVAPKDSAERIQHVQQLKAHSHAFVVVSVFAAVVAVAMAFKVAAAASAIAITGAVVAGLNAVYGVISLRRALKPKALVVPQPAPVVFHIDTARQVLIEKRVPQVTAKSFYLDIIHSMERAGDMMAQRDFLKNLLTEKIISLRAASTPQQFSYADRFQAPKRQAKIEALTLLENLLSSVRQENDTVIVEGITVKGKQLANLDALLAHLKSDKQLDKYVFQSAFRDVGGVQSLFATANKFFENAVQMNYKPSRSLRAA